MTQQCASLKTVTLFTSAAGFNLQTKIQFLAHPDKNHTAFL